MTKKEDIMGYLAQVQRMQLEAAKVIMTLAYMPSLCGFCIVLDTPISKDDNLFAFGSEYSEEKNRQTMEKLTTIYNQIEKRKQ